MLKNIFKSKKMVTDKQAASVDEILERGVNEVFPDKETVKKLLESGKKITLYLGIDPTGPTLHLGHAIVLKKLQEFQSRGHSIILLIGDFTGMIGDPTDKSATRTKLTREEVLENAKLYKKQASTFLNFTGPNKAKLQYNSTWLSKMQFGDVLELASYMTVDQMLKRDMFEKRMKEKKPIYVHEFLYPLLQGYDSVAMEVDGEIGGNDQMFNMLAGRTLLRQIKGKEKFVLTTKLLEDSSGKKMGKTEGNMVTLTDTPTDMFGKVMSWTDDMIVSGFELCTYVTNEEIENVRRNLQNDGNPKDEKVKLAKTIVALYYGEEAATKAEKNFESTFSKGGVSDDAVEINTTKKSFAEIFIEHNIVKSKKELERLVRDGAVTNTETGEKVTNARVPVSASATYKVGKRKFVKITLQ